MALNATFVPLDDCGHVPYVEQPHRLFEAVEAFLKSHSTIFVVEQNRDAQLKALLTLETAVEKSKLFSILSYSGFPISADPIVNGIRAKLAEAPRLTAVPRKP